jgi:hypothetical protein
MIEKITQLIEAEDMALCYKMLLLVAMCDLADEHGRAPFQKIAKRFKEFFAERAARGKLEENPRVFKKDPPSTRSLEEWERVIREEPVRRINSGLLVEHGNAVVWATEIHQNWSEWRDQIRYVAWARLEHYFDQRVPGGF